MIINTCEEITQMKKKIDILGRKIPVLAVMMVLLVIGTASAALIVNYAVLTGTVEVTNPIGVVGDGVDDPAMLDMTDDGVAAFTVTNTGTTDISVNVVTTLYLGLPIDILTPEEMEAYEVNDFEGITMNINGVPLTFSNGVYGIETITVAGGTVETDLETSATTFIPGSINVPVSFVADPGVVTGVYTIQVEVNPITTIT